MKQKFLYTSLFFGLLALRLFAGWWFWPQQEQTAVVLKQIPFTQLPGWETTNVRKSLLTFQVSCRTFLKQDPEQSVGSQQIELKAGDWHPACQEALSITSTSKTRAQQFFQKWFKIVEFSNNEPVRGLFTGYYMPLLHGSLTKTKKYNIPIYSLPSDLITINLAPFDPSLKNRRIIGRLEKKTVVPYYTRKEINKGAIANKAEVLVWIDNPIDRVFLEIQGSGIVQLPDGKRMYVGYAGQNGAPYTSIARVLIDKGVMTKDNASMQKIKSYLKAHPKEIDAVLNKNKSFVFFQDLKQNAAYGAQGVALTAGYSLAIDRKYIPLGAPIWLNTTRPDKHHDDKKVFQRLMIAQDTGGAIRGMVRGDVYWGAGKQATFIAGHMKNAGHYWLLLPRHIITQLEQKELS